MSHIKNTLDGDARRNEIILAARDLFEEKGLAETTVKDITNKVGVTRSLFYHYFPNKEAVTSAVLDNIVSDFVEALYHWNISRKNLKDRASLRNAIRILRMAVFEKGAFRSSLASSENASLYIEFLNRATESAVKFLLSNVVPEYIETGKAQLVHPYETMYILVLGTVGFLRSHPNIDDDTVVEALANMMHMHLQPALDS